MSMPTPRAISEAIDWHLALEYADGELWHGFIEWLEADPDHRAAYDRVVLDDALLQGRPASAPLIQTAPVASLRRRPRRAWAAGIAALAVAGGAAFLTLGQPATAKLYAIETGPSATRNVALPDGTRIALNRDTRIRLDRADPRYAILDRGEAMFDVHHDTASPFRVETGGRTIEDVGTRFDVVTDGRRIAVAVAEGAVRYDPMRGTGGILLTPGMTLRSTRDSAIELGHLPTTSIGGWRRGQLQFAGARLDDAAADIARSMGIQIRVAPSSASRRFTGTLRVARDTNEVIASFAALSGTRATREANGWLITADSDAAS